MRPLPPPDPREVTCAYSTTDPAVLAAHVRAHEAQAAFYDDYRRMFPGLATALPTCEGRVIYPALLPGSWEPPPGWEVDSETAGFIPTSGLGVGGLGFDLADGVFLTPTTDATRAWLDAHSVIPDVRAVLAEHGLPSHSTDGRTAYLVVKAEVAGTLWAGYRGVPNGQVGPKWQPRSMDDFHEAGRLQASLRDN